MALTIRITYIQVKRMVDANEAADNVESIRVWESGSLFGHDHIALVIEGGGFHSTKRDCFVELPRPHCVVKSARDVEYRHRALLRVFATRKNLFDLVTVSINEIESLDWSNYKQKKFNTLAHAAELTSASILPPEKTKRATDLPRCLSDSLTVLEMQPGYDQISPDGKYNCFNFSRKECVLLMKAAELSPE